VFCIYGNISLISSDCWMLFDKFKEIECPTFLLNDSEAIWFAWIVELILLISNLSLVSELITKAWNSKIWKTIFIDLNELVID